MNKKISLLSQYVQHAVKISIPIKHFKHWFYFQSQQIGIKDPYSCCRSEKKYSPLSDEETKACELNSNQQMIKYDILTFFLHKSNKYKSTTTSRIKQWGYE